MSVAAIAGRRGIYMRRRFIYGREIEWAVWRRGSDRQREREREKKMRTRLLAAGIAKRIKTRGNRQMSLGQSPAGPVRGAKEELRPWDPWAGCVAGAWTDTSVSGRNMCACMASTTLGDGQRRRAGSRGLLRLDKKKKRYSSNDNNIIYYIITRGGGKKYDITIYNRVE